jgi:hypothetical protein
MEVGIELVVGPACPETSFELVVLEKPAELLDSDITSFVMPKVAEADLTGFVPPLPIGSLVSVGEDPELDLGFEIVELAHGADNVQVYLNLLVDGEGGSGDPLVLLESDFDAGTESWTYDLGDLVRMGSGGPGGATDAWLLGEPNLENDTSYFVAPPKFNGDWTGYDALRLTLQSSGGTYYSSNRGYRGDVYLANGAMTAQYDLGHRPAATWEEFRVPLATSGGWTLGGGATSIADVLSNVTAFHVRGEYGVGGDDAGLDDVQLVVE